MFDVSPDAGLLGLFISALLSATVLPGTSELLLLALLHQRPELLWPAVLVATVGNTLGGGSTYLLGRLMPHRADRRGVKCLQRYGYWALLWTWLPVIGDALPLAAGWMRLNAALTMFLMGIGKFARYIVLGSGWTWLAVALPLRAHG